MTKHFLARNATQRALPIPGIIQGAPKEGQDREETRCLLEGLVFQLDLLNARAGVEWPRTECFSRIVG